MTFGIKDSKHRGQKGLINYMFLMHHPRHLQPPSSKIFIAFSVFTLKNHRELSVQVAAVLFVDCTHTTSQTFFLEITLIHLIQHFIQKNKKYKAAHPHHFLIKSA